jgi:hypothetical protein
LKVFSFGGGVQSMGVMVLAARGVLDYKTFLFANVGDDSEYPAPWPTWKCLPNPTPPRTVST